MEEREAQKRDASFRSKQPSSIDTTTPRLQPDLRRQPSFSSPAYSPAVSPSLSDHTSRGFYSPRGGEDDEVDEDEDEELHEVDDRGVLYRPRSPPVRESPVTTTVSRSVRVEPKVVTRVDSGPKDREYIERRVVEDGDMEFGAGRASARRKWEGRNTIVYDSGAKQKEVFPERGIGEEERNGRGMQSVGRNLMVLDSFQKERVVVPERRIVEDESVDFRDGRGRNSIGRNGMTFVSGSNEKEVVTGQRVVEEGSVEFRDGRGGNSVDKNGLMFDSGPKEKETVTGQRGVEEGNVEFRDGRAWNAVGRNAIVFDSGPKEMEVVTGQRVFEEGNVEFIDGKSLKLHGKNSMVLNSGPKMVYNSRPEEEAVRTRTVVYESEPNEEPTRVVEEGGNRGGEDSEAVMPSSRRRQQGNRSKVLMMRKASLSLRVLGCVMCLISFSVMAANKNKGWALDSFDRYKEFRYCMAVSLLGFVYSAAQTGIVSYHLVTDKYSNQHSHFRCYLDFFMDQALSYLLISAASSASTRVEDWVSNWGMDKFPHMATVSVIFSFLAFGAFAFSSVFSGYTLCSANVS